MAPRLMRSLAVLAAFSVLVYVTNDAAGATATSESAIADRDLSRLLLRVALVCWAAAAVWVGVALWPSFDPWGRRRRVRRRWTSTPPGPGQR